MKCNLIRSFELHNTCVEMVLAVPRDTLNIPGGGGGGGANGEMANLTNEKGKFAIAIFRHFSPFFAIFRHW